MYKCIDVDKLKEKLMICEMQFMDDRPSESFEFYKAEDIDNLLIDDGRENIEAIRVTYDQGTTHYYTCGQCGNPIDYEDRFCRHCGARIQEIRYVR